MIIITGAAGFIGSNIARTLNKRGINDLILVDDLTNGHKFTNLKDIKFADYYDKDNFLDLILNKKITQDIKAIFHQGAISATTEWNGKLMFNNNYEFSKKLLSFAQDKKANFIYASSASVYGINKDSSEDPINENPLNVYGFSKLCFDNYVRQNKFDIPVCGLRYFNVYGYGEEHKGSMASVAHHFNLQLKSSGEVKLFEGIDSILDGEQKRDFVFIDDIVNINLWSYTNNISGIFNAGSGCANSFNKLAQAVIDYHGFGKITYIKFPDHLKGAYQNYTKADLTNLKQAGYDQEFTSLQNGIKKYMDMIN